MSMFLSLSLTSASTSAQLFSSDETQSKLCQSLQISEAPGLVLHPRRSARIISCPFPRPGKRVRLHFHRESQHFARMPRNRRCNIQIFHHRQDLVITLSHAASGEIPDMRVTPQKEMEESWIMSQNLVQNLHPLKKCGGFEMFFQHFFFKSFALVHLSLHLHGPSSQTFSN